MNPHNSHTDFEALVIKYLAGEASQSEIEMLEFVVKSDYEKRKLFSQYKKTWLLSKSIVTQIDLPKAWEAIEARIEKPKSYSITPTGASQTFRMFLRVAAVILFLVGGTLTYIQLTRVQQISLVALQDTETIVLKDYTEINLNRNSSIIYPSKFRDDERRVKLVGDAYFRVVHNPEKPFIVETQHLDIIVLGTAFYVNAHPESPTVEIIVKEGTVGILLPNKPIFKVTANNRGVFDVGSGELTKDDNIDPNFLSWKTLSLEFTNTYLEQVITTLEKTYSENIVLEDEALGDYMLTATFHDLPLEDVLVIIAETFDLESRIDNNTFYLNRSPI